MQLNIQILCNVTISSIKNQNIQLLVSQEVYMEKHSLGKPGTPGLVPSKTIIASWLKSLFPDLPLSLKIQDFGDGVIYCRLLNHFYSNPPHSKITWSPKNQYQYINNLKHVQTALLQLSITIPIDVNRVCKRKFLQNWALINSFYKHFNSGDESVPHEQNSNPVHNNLAQMTAIHHHMPQSQTNTSNHTPKNVKRMNPSHPYLSQLEQVIHQSRLAGHALQHQQSFWDHSLPLNFAHLANSSLQISQLLKQNVNVGNNITNSTNTPTKGKWSVGAQAFQNNYHAVIDRVKQILLKGSHDTEKVRQIKMLLGMPIQQQQVIKIQDDDVIGHVIYNQEEHKIDEKIHASKVQDKVDASKIIEEQSIPKPVQVLPKLEQKRVEVKEVKDYRQAYQMIHKQASTNSLRQNKYSMSKSAKKPFKI